jgi:SAM-dependent methyltransferase
MESKLSKPLEFTGERFAPECVREIWYEHYHRYVFARGLVTGRKVLDAACGEGYGSALMATEASSVTGVDLSTEAVGHAQSRYSSENLKFVTADCVHLPFDDDEFDTVVSFETLEHLEDHQGLMAEFRRVLKPEGFLLLSTPDKAIYTDQQQNQNEFHLRELNRDEFESLLQAFYPAFRLWGHKLMFQSAIWSLEQTSGVVFHQERDGQTGSFPQPGHPAVYLIAVCAAEERFLPAIENGLQLFDDATESVYEHYYHEIRKNMSAGALLEEKNREIEELRKALENVPPRPGWWSRLLGRP